MGAHHDHGGRGHGSHGHAGHGHAGHGHGAHAPMTGAAQGRAFMIGIVLNLGFLVAEAVAGLLANSMALLADAGHNLSDVLGLAMSFAAFRLARRKPTPRFTYGFRASSILAALFNGVLLLVACGALLLEAGRRLFEPAEIAGGTVAVVALIGVLVNAATALLFARGAKGDLNVRGAFLHMAADAAVSVGVAIAGLLTLRTALGWIDPVTSLLVIGVILIGTWGLLREALALALHAVPAGIEPAEVANALAALPGVVRVHHLHIWPMSTTETALTAHLVVRADAPVDLLSRAAQRVEHDWRIAHCTFQVERDDATEAGLAPASCEHV